jgi:molybdopterin converting factor small subunit
VRVEVRLHATLAAFLPPGSREGAAPVGLPEGATIARLIERLAIPVDLARVVLVAGHDVPDDHVLHADDVVDIFPPLAGGSSARWYTRNALEASRNPVGLPDFKSGVRL